MNLVPRKYFFVTLILNILFGGLVYAVVNYYLMDLPLNYLSASAITILGVPGVMLLVALKYLFILF